MTHTDNAKVAAGEVEHLSVQARIDGRWIHYKSVPAWVLTDKGHLAIQRKHVRDLARADHGFGPSTAVELRFVTDAGQIAA